MKSPESGPRFLTHYPTAVPRKHPNIDGCCIGNIDYTLNPKARLGGLGWPRFLNEGDVAASRNKLIEELLNQPKSLNLGLIPQP